VTTDLLRHAEVAGLVRGMLTEPAVTDLARQVLADPAAGGGTWRIDPVDYDFGTPTTKGAVRLRGATGDHRDWSVFVKVVQAFRHWPHLGLLPPALRQQALDSPLWRYETDVYASELGGLLPAGLRLPVMYAAFELGDDRLAFALEDITVADVPWDDHRFGHAARLLGQMAVRLTRADALPASASRVPGEMSRILYEGNLRIATLPALADERTWAHPLLLPWRDTLRPDLIELGDRVPALLHRLARLPQLMVHGDASPQNLLVPADRPDTFVAIDWSLGEVAAAGQDLGQLLIGLAHAGQLPVADLPRVRDLVIDAYLDGTAAEGFTCSREQVAYGLDGGLAIRSAFTALPLHRLPEPPSPELRALLQDRLHLTRYLCDLGLALDPQPPARW
jgi:hypothetical protein